MQQYPVPSSFPNVAKRRRAPNDVGGRDPLQGFDTVAPCTNGDRHLRVSLNGNELSTTFINPPSANPPPLILNPNAPPTGVSIPKKVYAHFENLSNNFVECSFLGNNCNSCAYKGGNHSLKGDARFYFLGDSFIPPAIGGMEDCSPVIRVGQASFSNLKEVLLAQKMHGFFPHASSVAIVCMLEHLLKVGNQVFWSQFDVFSTWLTDTFGWGVMPTLPPLPDDLSTSQLNTIQQFFKTLQCRFLGDFQGKKSDNYILWKAFSKTNNLFAKEKTQVHPPPVALNGGIILDCQGLLPTSCGNFSKEIPTEIQTAFLLDIFDSAKLAIKTDLIIPNLSSIERGLKGARARAAPGMDDPQGNTLFLYGTSILRAVVDPVSTTASNYGVNVIAKCIGGDFFKNVLPFGLPESSKPKDVLVLHFLGNNMFYKKSHFLNDKNYHMLHPNYLDDEGVNGLIDKLSNIIKDTETSFKGKIFILGPFPRFLTPCCPDPKHALPCSDVFKSPLAYCKLLNDFMSQHPGLRHGQHTTFIPFQAIFGPDIPCPFTMDMVHLSHRANSIFACSLATITKKSNFDLPNIIPGRLPSFTTWAACQLQLRSSAPSNAGPPPQASNIACPLMKPATATSSSSPAVTTPATSNSDIKNAVTTTSSSIPAATTTPTSNSEVKMAVTATSSSSLDPTTTASANTVDETKLCKSDDFDSFLQSLEDEYGHVEVMETVTTPMGDSETVPAPMDSHTPSVDSETVLQAAKQFILHKMRLLKLRNADKTAASSLE